MKRLNLKFIAFLCIGFLALAVGVKLVHDLQVRRNATKLLAQADAAHADGEADLNVQMLQRYVAYQPDDTERRTELAIRFVSLITDGDSAPSRVEQGRAVKLVERALYDDPDNPQLHWVASRLFLEEMHSPADALTHLEKVREAFEGGEGFALPDDKTEGDVLYDLARVRNAMGNRDEAVSLLRSALGYTSEIRDYDPRAVPPTATPSTFALYATMMARDEDDDESAHLILDQMVAALPNDYDTYLQRAQYFMRENDDTKWGAQIDQDIARAGELGRDEPDVILMQATNALQTGQPDKALEVLVRGRELFPDNPSLYLAQADAARQGNDLEQAVRYIDEGLVRLRNNPSLLIYKARVLAFARDAERLRETNDRIRDLGYGGQDLWEYLEAERLVVTGDYLGAYKILQRVTSRLPEFMGYRTVQKTYSGLCGVGSMGWKSRREARSKRGATPTKLPSPTPRRDGWRKRRKTLSWRPKN